MTDSSRPHPSGSSERGQAPHEAALRGWLDGLRRRWRLLTGLGVAARSGAAIAALLLGTWATERLAAPVGVSLVLLFVAAIVLAGAIVALFSRPLWATPSDQQLARLAEERDPSLDDVLVTATDKLDAASPGPFDSLLVKSAAARVDSLDASHVIDRDTMRRAVLLAGAALLLFFTGAGVVHEPAWRAWQTARLYIAPPRLTLVVEPGDARVVRGSPLRIVARVEGMPEGATPEPPRVHVSGSAQPLTMKRDGQRYVAEMESVDRSLRYRVASGALTSREFQVAALDAARVKRIDVEYEFPAFAKLAPRREEDTGDIYGPAGTTVKVRVLTDKPVVGGSLALREGDPVALAPSRADTELAGTFTLKQDGAYRVALRDLDGLSSRGDTEYFIRVMDDRPPDVRIMRPGGDRQVTRLEEIVVEARADDDHGISNLELVYAVRGGKEKVVPLHRAPAKQPETAGKPGVASASVTGAHTLFVEEMDVQPGDFITYFARARDVSRGKPSTEARSDIFFLEVRPFGEEFFAAQSQAGMGGGGSQAADLLESQKEIIVATWKLQRRAMAGQSAQDVKAVGKAQGELRARAEAMAAQMGRTGPRRPRPGAAPVLPAPVQPEENPLHKAAGSMARAETSLNGLKPGDAVPHEMAAYNELLKLQAEITRRQVQRQRGGGGGGGRSGNQDLSALFDEELLRQQDNNYENKESAGGSQNAEQQDSALDKLKELARRQDEIAQRQRELARARTSLPQEEMKRQLDRLTREQEQLRRDTEALSQQMASRQQGSQQQQQGSQQSGQQASAGQSGQSGQSQSGQGQSGQNQAGEGQSGQQTKGQNAQNREGSERLREAAQEMANASQDLSRADLEEARQRTDQTLARLRELERRMAGEAVPDEGRRAFGEMQLEAQQLAESQRRIANEARRVEREGGAAGQNGATGSRASGEGASGSQQAQARAGAGDALRRLAAEQERLAERMSALEKRLRGVSKTAGGDDAAKAAAAARDELQRRQLADEMRRMAGALRAAGNAAPPGNRGAGTQPQRPGSDPRAEQADVLAQDAARVAERLGASVAGNREMQQLTDQLARLRNARERMDEIEQRLRDAMQQAGNQTGTPSGQQGGRNQPGQPGAQQGSEGSRAGAQSGAQASNAQSGAPSGSQSGGSQSGGSQSGGSQSGGQRGGGGGGGSNGDIARLQAEYNNALRETRTLMEAMGRDGNRDGVQNGAMSTPEGHEFSRSAPGTEAFKQDYSRWDVLTKDVNLALEQAEASLAQRLSDRAAKDRVHAGGDDRAPAQYSESVSRYYRSLAKKPTP